MISMNNSTKELTNPQKFLIVGIVASEDFQKCRYAITKLYKSFPKEFDKPDIRPMLDVEWNEFIIKLRRKLGNELWSIKNHVAIFRNGEFLGDFLDLQELIWKKWKYVFNEDWQCLAIKHVLEYLDGKIEQCRHLVYLTIAIDKRVIGSLLFELYSDLVPLACENFLNLCKNTSNNNGYDGVPIHRIVQNSWIQCGGDNIEPIKMPCENYVIPHDRRGVLSTCNNRPHKENSTHFFISLESAPWMNYKYVGFGQLLHGDDILKAIEQVPTNYQAPIKPITIVKCGEYLIKSETLFNAEELEQWKEIQMQEDILEYLKTFHVGSAGEADDDQNNYSPIEPQNSCDSILNPKKIPKGIYSFKSDQKSCAPLVHLPKIQEAIMEKLCDINLPSESNITL